MEFSRRSDVSFPPRRASRDCRGLGDIPSLAGKRTTTTTGNDNGAKAQASFWARFWRCYARSRQRQALSRLDDRTRKDLGITREQAIAEAAKPFWK